LEKIFRIRELQTLCRNGCSPLELRDHCETKWAMPRRTANNYVKETYESLAEALTCVNKRQVALVVFYRLENSYKVARAAKNPSAMIQACVAQANLFVERAPDDVVAANQQSRAAAVIDPDEDFE
jgi:nucleoid DNA-binding protein